jgi:hypothetical protein
MCSRDKTSLHSLTITLSKSLASLEEKSAHGYDRSKDQVMILACFKDDKLKCALCHILPSKYPHAFRAQAPASPPDTDKVPSHPNKKGL